MSWTETDSDDSSVVGEWEREDGWATIRLRRGRDEGWVVRLDRLTQAPEGSLYLEERLPTRAEAETVVTEWTRRYDVDE